MFIKFFFLSFVVSSVAKAQTLATISYKSSKGAVQVTITTKEFQEAYSQLRQITTNAPSAKQFWNEYLLYRIGVEHAYNDPSLIKNPNIKNAFVNPQLKESFEQILYKQLAETKLKSRISKVNTTAQKLPTKTLQSFYRKNPEFDVNFIVITAPIGASAAQLKEARDRASSIYNDIRKSKRPFANLIDLYSDDRISGQLNITRTRQTIYPSVYAQLKKMKNGQISSPIRTPEGFYIVKLNKKIPFSQANKMQIKATYFDQKRGQVISNYFNSLKKKYKININPAALNRIN